MMQTSTTQEQQHVFLLLKAYRAFTDRNVGGVLNLMHPDVDWQDGLTGERVHGHSGLRNHWLSQWTSLTRKVLPMHVVPSGDRLEVEAVEIIRSLDGTSIRSALTRQTIDFRGGKIARVSNAERTDSSIAPVVDELDEVVFVESVVIEVGASEY